MCVQFGMSFRPLHFLYKMCCTCLESNHHCFKLFFMIYKKSNSYFVRFFRSHALTFRFLYICCLLIITFFTFYSLENVIHVRQRFTAGFAAPFLNLKSHCRKFFEKTRTKIPVRISVGNSVERNRLKSV